LDAGHYVVSFGRLKDRSLGSLQGPDVPVRYLVVNKPTPTVAPNLQRDWRPRWRPCPLSTTVPRQSTVRPCAVPVTDLPRLLRLFPAHATASIRAIRTGMPGLTPRISANCCVREPDTMIFFKKSAKANCAGFLIRCRLEVGKKLQQRGVVSPPRV
jgi:hypothetical protein